MTTTLTRLTALEASFPKLERTLSAEIGMELASLGIKFEVAPPKPVVDIATFHHTRRRSLTPQLKDRFNFASEIVLGTETWLGGHAIEKVVKRAAIRRYHEALREEWANSAPAQFRDDQLSVFSLGEDPSDSLTYLVWADDGEPQLWTYSGQSETKFKNLDAKLAHELQF